MERETAKPRQIAGPPANRASAQSAQPKVQPFKSFVEQDHYRSLADETANKLGFQGDPNWVLRGIQNSDARKYLTQKFHEAHQSAHNPKDERFTMPTGAQLAEHLGSLEDAAYLDKQIALAAAVGN